MKNLFPKILLGLLGATYLSLVSQLDLNFLFFKSYIPLIPIQIGILIYMLYRMHNRVKSQI